MTILVSGGAGYIGSHMVAGLVDNGEQPVVLDNLSTGFEWALAPGATLVKGDISDQALVAKIIKEHDIDAVVHFAGSIVVPESIVNPLGYYDNNTVKSRALIEACVQNGVKKFIFSSTAAVYGEPESSQVYEDDPLVPISPYGTSKLMTEMMLRDVSKAHDFNYVALRYFNVAGADPAGRTGQSTPNATHLIKVACQVALGQREKMAIYGLDYDTPDGTCIRDYIHVSDLIAAHLCALDYLNTGGESGVFNCGYSQGFSVLDVIGAVERVAELKLNVEHAPRRAGDPPALVAGAKRVREILKWQPQYDDLDLIVKTALDWERGLEKRKAG